MPSFSASCANARPPHRRREIAAELLDEIHGHPGMDAALTIEKFGFVIDRHHRPMPDVWMKIEALASVAPESDELFRRDVIARQRERNYEALPFERIKKLAAVRVIVRAPDERTFARTLAGVRCGLFRPVAP